MATARTSMASRQPTGSWSPPMVITTSSPLLDPAEPAASTAMTALPPRPADVRRDPARLASRFVAEWLTYAPGTEVSASLAARLSELVTAGYRSVIEGLSTAGMTDRPGSVAEL